MSFKRALTLLVAAAVVLPASAAAQAPIPPPEGDNYLGPIALSDFSSPGKFPSTEIGFTADTTNYTVQADMFNPPSSGGPQEPTNCGSPYGNTIWSVFYADRYGVMKISTAGPFDSVIGFVPFNNPNTNPTPDISNGICIDRLSGFEEELSAFVRPRHWYAVQVGGTGAVLGGQLQVKFDYQNPPPIDGDAVLTWRTNGTTAKITKLVVSAPKGATVAVSCTHNGCGRNPRPFKAKQTFVQPIGEVGPSAKARAGVHMTASFAGAAKVVSAGVSGGSALRPKAEVHAAKKFQLLKGRKLKNGSTIIIRITRSGYIGKYFTYSVRKGTVSAKTIRCTNPGSSTPRKKCP